MIRKTLIAIAILLVVIQFFRPEKNIAVSSSSNAIDLHYTISQEVKGILRTSCYDCHSNNTVYPWYSNIQPFAWWQESHVIDGKKELNFDEFNSYDVKRKKHKLDEVIEMIQEDEMPLGSYTLIHRNAVLSPQDKEKLISWARSLEKTLD